MGLTVDSKSMRKALVAPDPKQKKMVNTPKTHSTTTEKRLEEEVGVELFDHLKRENVRSRSIIHTSFLLFLLL